ncbi:MAG: (2Fe-2S)-binding protein [Rhodothermales bacterium]|nr:(2Fe-2S)-binding protein [Rhodothermales bacterium]
MAKKDKRAQEAVDGGVSRRDFLSTAGLGVFGLAAVGPSAKDPPADDDPVVPAGTRVPVELRVNGNHHRLLVEPRWSLLFVLREKLGLAGSKNGCHRGECGACTVLIDDVPRYACMTLAVEAQAAAITTVEGLMAGEELGPVQEAFLENDAFQCGYCTPGQIMAVEGLLRSNPDPTLEEIQTGVSGNLCRCGAYPNIFKAASQAAELRRGGGAS